MKNGSRPLMKNVKLGFKNAFLALTFLLMISLCFGCTVTGKNPQSRDSMGQSTIWPQDNSDLEPDGQLVFGHLGNGLRYVIRKNQTPKDRVSLHLYIQVGSMHERDDEQGMAHFLEHMLFNGTKNFPPGEMVKYFQRIGMQFGPDANAHTGFNETVYDVILPKGDRQSLSEGLLVLRDYADGALLLPEEVDKERKVILAEMRSRDSARFRTLKQSFRFEMPGLVFGSRFPIGEAHVIEKIDHQMMRDFYQSWYRPERMFLVVVGDLSVQTATELIEERFSDLKAQHTARPVPDVGRMHHKGVKAFHHYEKDAGATSVAIETIVQQDEPLDSTDYQRKKMLKSLADSMMQQRLDGIVRQPESELTSAGIGGGYYLRQIHYTEISGQTSPEKWTTAAMQIEQALRKALRFGFTSTEFNRAKNEYRARLLKSVEEEGTRESKTLARQIMAGIRNWQVLQSPRQKMEMLIHELDRFSLEQVNEAFADMWSADHRLVMVTGNARLSSKDMPAEKQILSSYQSSNKLAVSPPEEKSLAVFPYLPLPEASGTIVTKERVEDLGITKVAFANGIHLLLKSTPFKENQVLANLSFGNGRSSEPDNQPGLAKLTQAVVNDSGFGALDRLELKEALAGRLAQIHLSVRQDLFTVKGTATAKELPLLFQLFHSFVLDPGFREEARQLALKQFEQEHLGMSKSVDGIMKLKGRNFLAGGDRRVGVPPMGELRRRTLEQVKAWLSPQLRHAPMELSLVGDFDVERVIELAARYIGSLPKRNKAAKVLPVSGPSFPKGEMLNLQVDSQTPKALVVVAYPTEDFWNIKRTRRLSIMAELYSERLRQHIRENLGAAYSPYAYNRSFRAYKGYGLTQIFVQVDPNQAQTIVDEVRKIAQNLSSTQADPDEFRRVLDPTLTHVKDLRQKNTYWLNSVLTGASRHPEQLDWARSFESDYAAIQSNEISALARKYLINENAATIILFPEAD